MVENNTGELTLTSNSYSYQMTDTLLNAKQAALSVSSVSGSSLLSGSVLKRIAAGTGLSIADSGHALMLTNTLDWSTKQDVLQVNASAGGTPVIDMGNNTVRKLETSGDAIVQLSTQNAGATLRLSCDGHTKARIATLLSSYATTSSVTADTATSASASYLDAVTYTNTAISNNAITNHTGTGVDLLYNGALRNLSFSGAIAYAFRNSFQTREINVPCYTQTESDA